MSRPRIWVTPNDEHRSIRRELARDNHKLTDMDRLAIAEYICILARALVADDEHKRHDLVFQGIPLPDLSEVDLVEMGMQAFSSLRYR